MSTPRRSTSSTEQTRADKPIGLPIEVLNRQRLYPIDTAHAASLAREVLHRIERQDASLTISFIRDRQMRQLNRDYRGFDKPTDVLSFAYHEGEEFADIAALEGETVHLGDVVISVETAARYATELGLSFAREIEFLVIHGTLHLAGYDHETDHGEMNRLEKKLRKQLLR